MRRRIERAHFCRRFCSSISKKLLPIIADSNIVSALRTQPLACTGHALFHLLSCPQRAQLSRELAARLAKPAAEEALRRGDHRRRRAWTRHRLLPSQRARHAQYRRVGKGLAWRRQYGTQYNDRAFELSPRPERALLRVFAEVVGAAFANTELQRDVQRARGAEPRAFARRYRRGNAPWQCDAPERHRRRVSIARADREVDSQSRLLGECALPDPGWAVAATRGYGAARRGRLGLCARSGRVRRR